VGRRVPHSLRGELLQAEDASWAEFRAITGQLNPEQMSRPGYQDHEEHLPRLREWVDLLEIPE
jgi:hypothetical protein